ncbi:anthranilate synthase component I [Legionella impletisoli]|uniref:Anthranilate synthase n=1 Tax=Legionella impletisoli TaxID=343510 RepID=A0A917JPF8_9GAMM|nr:anthranilate synthase component I [Legionella impletisoli]GGI75571.1 anthranilate synthase component I [Legionella impletisoli]
MQTLKTAGGIVVESDKQDLAYPQPLDHLIDALNAERGALFTSGFEYPGRYTCWDIGFHNPPLVLSCKNSRIKIEALNPRGTILLDIICKRLKRLSIVELTHYTNEVCELRVFHSDAFFTEEERSQQPSVFSVIREIVSLFKSDEEPYLGLYGAFGYDLIFQFEDLKSHQVRHHEDRTLVLYLPDEIFIVNHRKEEAFVIRYDFFFEGKTTSGLDRTGLSVPYHPTNTPNKEGDHAPSEYANVVNLAKERFRCGDLFEVVPSQTFYRHAKEQPSEIFKRMREVNPAPYGFFINLGEQEYLVGASPEMYVRVQGRRVETCPISGTIKRGENAIEDAKNIQELLESEKECSELTMCTDVDRNDKSRICKPGSVRVIGRRQIEMYSRLIHTVDHVEGVLRDEFDAIDAFLSHMWVVTVTGAPKLWAMNFIEQHEKSPRRWYGGAVGWLGFNGDLNTGLVLRTLRIKEGIAEIRVGATLLYDSNPEAEEQETRLKASAFIDLLDKPKSKDEKQIALSKDGEGKRILLIDHEDSFVHTLANYFRQTGAEVITVRYDQANYYLTKPSQKKAVQQHATLKRERSPYDLVILSPGPGNPKDFDLSEIISTVLTNGIPLFGVCLGLQGIVEHFGGTLGVLDYPMHGKPSVIEVFKEENLFAGLGKRFTAGRYHSLYAKKENFPSELDVTAESEDGVIMAIAHKTRPIYAVQFHPETILSLPNQAGLRIICNLMRMIKNNAR